MLEENKIDFASDEKRLNSIIDKTLSLLTGGVASVDAVVEIIDLYTLCNCALEIIAAIEFENDTEQEFDHTMVYSTLLADIHDSLERIYVSHRISLVEH